MSSRKNKYEMALETSRREFLKNSVTLVAGIGAASLVGLPMLASAQKPAPTKAVAVLDTGTPYPWQPVYGQGAGQYNLLNGNNLVSHIVTRSDSLDFILYHNSTSSATGGPLGSKWGHSFSGQIVTAVGTATYVAGNGTAWIFTLSGSSYVAPTGYWRSLVLNSDSTWTLTDLQGTLSLHFLSNGALDSVRNSLTGAVLIQCNYTSGTLTSVTKGSDTLTFGYTGGLITSVTDVLGNVHTLTYTGGSLTKHSFPAVGGSVYNTQFGYNSSGIVNQVTDSEGGVWGYTYNSSGLLTGTTDASGNTASYLCGNSNPYPAGGWPLDVVSAGVVTTPSGADQYGFDSVGRVVAHAGTDSDTAVYNYDSNNNLTSRVLAGGGTWSWTYDSVGRLASATTPSGVVNTITRDSNGRIVSDSVGGITPMTLTYNTNSNVTQAALTGGDVISITYDSQSNATSATDTTSGANFSATYDSNNNLLTFVNVLGNTTERTYTNNLVTSVTDARGRVTNITRDSWGRMTLAQFPTTGNPNNSWAYDALDHLVSASTAAGSYGYAYNANSLLSSRTGPDGTVSATVDSSNRPETITDISGRYHTLNWGSNSAISSIVLSDGSGTVSYSYNSNNQLASCTLPNGTMIVYGYDSNSRLTSVTNKVVSSGAVLVSYTGTFNATTGLLTQVTEAPSGAVTSFTYDSLGRMTQETRTGTNPYAATYTYGSRGQVLTAVRSENGVVSHNGTYTYSSAGLLTQVVDSATGITEPYTWYPDTTLATFPGPGYTRDLDYYEDGSLLSISRNYGSGGVLAYQFYYDPQGSLVRYDDHVLGLTTEFVVGIGQFGGDLLAVYQRPLAGGSWTEIASYIQGANAVVAASGVYYCGGLVGAPFVATNASAAISGTCLFDSLGVYRTPFGSGTLAAAGDLPGRLVLDGVTIGIPNGKAAILERYLTIC